MLCRLILFMCLNFLGLIYFDSYIIKEDNIEEIFYIKVKLILYCEWIKIMNLKFVKFLDFVIFFFFFFIEYCKNREKKMILLMFKWKFFVFFFRLWDIWMWYYLFLMVLIFIFLLFWFCCVFVYFLVWGVVFYIFLGFSSLLVMMIWYRS